MTKVTVRHEEHVASHGKPAKGKGCWVFSKSRNATVDEMFFDNQHRTVAQSAKVAAEHFGVTEVWAQP
jgi:hypothetical protein